MLKTFIQRPVLSTVISIIIVVLGIIGLMTLPVEQYPDIAPLPYGYQPPIVEPMQK